MRDLDGGNELRPWIKCDDVHMREGRDYKVWFDLFIQ